MNPQVERQLFRQTVAEVAEKARALLPASVNGRVESAVKLVLLDEIRIGDDGTITVGSCTDPAKVYTLTGTTCDCQDFPRAPESWCKHRIAAGIDRRVRETIAAQAVAAPSAPALPEAPASVNVRLVIDGREVQLTLRDMNELNLLIRLRGVLAQYPMTQPEIPVDQGVGWCKQHQVGMKQNQKNGRTWWSHRTAEGDFCKGR